MKDEHEYNQFIISELARSAELVYRQTQRKVFALATPAFGIVVFAVPGEESQNGWYKNLGSLYIKVDDCVGSIQIDSCTFNVFDWIEAEPTETDKLGALQIIFIGIEQEPAQDVA
jgi:hypothetical protein